MAGSGSGGGSAALLIDSLKAADRQMAQAQARRAQLMVQFADARRKADRHRIAGIESAGGDPRYRAGEFAATEVGLAVTTTKPKVERVVAMVRRLQGETPDVWDAWVAGEINELKAERVNHALCRLVRDESKRLLNMLVVPVAMVKTPELLGRWLNQFVARVEPAESDERIRRSLEDRYASVRPDLDGVSFLSACMSSLDAASVDLLLEALAGAVGPGETRTKAQRRADALVDLLLGRISNGWHWSGCGLDEDGASGGDAGGVDDCCCVDCGSGARADVGERDAGGAVWSGAEVDIDQAGVVETGPANADADADVNGDAGADSAGGVGLGADDAAGAGAGGDAGADSAGGVGLCADDAAGAGAGGDAGADGTDSAQDAAAGGAGGGPGAEGDSVAGAAASAQWDEDADWDLPAGAFRPDPGGERDPDPCDASDPDPCDASDPDPCDAAGTGTGATAGVGRIDGKAGADRDGQSGGSRGKGAGGGRCPGCHGRPVPRVTIGVVVSAQSLLGFSDTPGQLADRSALVPAAVIRELAGLEGTLFYRLLTDPVGGVLDVTELGRFPSRRLAAAVRFRDGVCTNPICHVAAQRCDLDHVVPWPEGPTAGWNLGDQCRHDHRAKTHAGFGTTLDQGKSVWTTPTGHQYVQGAEPLPVEQWPDTG